MPSSPLPQSRVSISIAGDSHGPCRPWIGTYVRSACPHHNLCLFLFHRFGFPAQWWKAPGLLDKPWSHVSSLLPSPVFAAHRVHFFLYLFCFTFQLKWWKVFHPQRLLDTPWSKVSSLPLPPPGTCLRFFSCIGFSFPSACRVSSIFFNSLFACLAME